ncbi:MAG: hypothetical protein WD577_13870 [Bacteroidales bacterium]
MTSIKKIQNHMPEEPKNPFVVPDGYFNELGDRVMDRINEADRGGERSNQLETTQKLKPGRRISLRPYLTLAASMAGIALVIYVLLQTIVGNKFDTYSLYDLELLEQTGVTYDEAIISEAYSMDEESPFSEWDENAMVYLSSNEVDLLHLLESN